MGHMAMTLRLTDEQDATLASLAEAQGVSKNEAAVRAIRAAHERAAHERRVGDAIDDVIARYPETIRRLGE